MKKLFCTLCLTLILLPCLGTPAAAEEQSYIKWIDFTPTYDALSDALEADIAAHNAGKSISWVDILAYHAARCGGDFSSYSSSDTTSLIESLSDGSDIASHVRNTRLFGYYQRAYGAVLGGLVGEFTRVSVAEDGSEVREQVYGLRGYSPIAKGYYYADFDDFGASRSYGYRRRHLGHDLMGSVGTPVVAVESGYAEAVGWNQYGGWRIGIRSFDGQRYYYYAHLRRDHPYLDMYPGKIVNAGEVIGYLGMTGYSAKENVNNIDTPHLHYGLQIIFHPSQKDGTNQIWVDMYALTRLLYRNRAAVLRRDGELYSRSYAEYPETPD